jgi:hypothetical protein
MKWLLLAGLLITGRISLYAQKLSLRSVGVQYSRLEVNKYPYSPFNIVKALGSSYSYLDDLIANAIPGQYGQSYIPMNSVELVVELGVDSKRKFWENYTVTTGLNYSWYNTFTTVYDRSGKDAATGADYRVHYRFYQEQKSLGLAGGIKRRFPVWKFIHGSIGLQGQLGALVRNEFSVYYDTLSIVNNESHFNTIELDPLKGRNSMYYSIHLPLGFEFDFLHNKCFLNAWVAPYFYKRAYENFEGLSHVNVSAGVGLHYRFRQD